MMNGVRRSCLTATYKTINRRGLRGIVYNVKGSTSCWLQFVLCNIMSISQMMNKNLTIHSNR